VKDRKDKAMSNETNDASKMDLSRRNVLKVAIAGLLAGVAVPLFSHLSSIHATATGTGRKKVLIVYYSRSGNTREIASQIHRSVGGDIFEIQVVEPYPEDYEEVKKIAMQEQQSGFKPALKTKVKNFGSCDVIFVGTPIWWGTISAPVKSFLSEYDFSGKTIVPFCTHGGSGLGRSITDIAALCPHSTILDGLAVWGKNVKTAQNDVSAWVRRLKVEE
jgi:flavodoxin